MGQPPIAWQPGYSASTNRYLIGSYDNDGNVLNDGSDTFVWDVYGKLRSEQPSGMPAYVFTRDAFGHTVETSYNGAYQGSPVSVGNFFSLMSGQTNLQFHLPTVNGSFYRNGPGGGQGGAGNYLADWLGSIRATSSYGGAPLASGVSIAPFGEYYNLIGGYVSDYPFAGLGNDGYPYGPNNVTHFAAERSLRASQGRWNSPDPYDGSIDVTDPQTLNRYAYVRNSPLDSTDPTGLIDCSDPHIRALCQAGLGPYRNFFFTWDPLNVVDVWSREGNLYGLFTPLPPATAGSGCIYALANPCGTAPNSAANNGPLTPQQRKALHCVGQALADKGFSILLDIAGSIPAVGSLVSGVATTIKAVDHAALGINATADFAHALMNPNDKVGLASGATSFGLLVINAAGGGTKVLPAIGNFISAGTGIYDAYQAYKTYQQCMAGGG